MIYNEAIRNARIQVVIDSIDSSASTLKFYSGTKPSSVDVDITDQVLLCEIAFSNPCSSSITNGVATMANLSATLAIENGTVSFARIMAGEIGIVDLDVSEISSEITTDTAIMYKGVLVSIEGWTLSD